MSVNFLLKIITPNKVVFQDEVEFVTVPTKEGEITVLHGHTPLFSLLEEGVVKVKKSSEEFFLSIGGGYLETTGKEVNLLVSRAYRQDELDEQSITKAKEEAEKLLERSKTNAERHEAMAAVRRSFIDLKVVKFRRRGKRPLS